MHGERHAFVARAHLGFPCEMVRRVNVADFPIVPSETAMLFFDTLNRYLHPEDSKRQDAINASGVILRMMQMNRACRQAGIAIFYAQADHRPDGRDWGRIVIDRGIGGEEGPRYAPPTVGVAGSHGVDIVPELAPEPGDYVVKKHRWSTFHQTHLDLSLRTAGINTIMIAGGAIDIGIASTVYSARDHDYSVIVLRDICTGDADLLDLFMNRVFPKMARVQTVNQAISLFKR
ncbi:MAG: isochorismatase family protein [Chloroflexi bacterium]|nr:isochorismatase family protein [Chloroflexota bacterium]